MLSLSALDIPAKRRTQGGRANSPRPEDYGKDRLYFGRKELHIEPARLPDGKEIIFISNHGVSLGSGGLWRMSAEPRGMAKARKVRREEMLCRTVPTGL